MLEISSFQLFDDRWLKIGQVLFLCVKNGTQVDSMRLICVDFGFNNLWFKCLYLHWGWKMLWVWIHFLSHTCLDDSEQNLNSGSQKYWKILEYKPLEFMLNHYNRFADLFQCFCWYELQFFLTFLFILTVFNVRNSIFFLF